jgi:hypothetical protein
MILNEENMRILESHIPYLADAAFTQAYWQTLAMGSSVLKVEQGKIFEIFPDGSRKLIKKISPTIPVILGQKRIAR